MEKFMDFVKIADAPNTYNYAIDKLIQWGYEVSVVNDKADFIDQFIWIAEKDGKKFSAIDPLRLLGLVTIVKEYGDAWDQIEVATCFSIKPVF
jgi:hypothetical protein